MTKINCWINSPSTMLSERFPGIPYGGIIGLAAGYSTPIGYSGYDTNTGKFILSETTPNSIGGSSAIGDFATDGGNSHHQINDYWIFARSEIGTGSLGPPGLAGSHNHTLTGPTYTPRKSGLKLIISNSNGASVPTGGILFSNVGTLTTSDTSYTTFNNETGYLSHETSTRVIGASQSNGSISTVAFAHGHNRTGTGTAIVINPWVSLYDTYSLPQAGPAHSHTPTLAFTPSMKKCILKAFSRISSSNEVANKTIIMFEGSTAPPGWAFCNGLNGTINLINHFIYFSIENLGTTSGTHTISFTSSLTYSGSHNHPVYTSNNGWGSYWSHNGAHTHNHNVSGSNISWAPPYRTLKFMQYML